MTDVTELQDLQRAQRIREREQYLVGERRVAADAISTALEQVDGDQDVAIEDVLVSAAAVQALGEHPESA